MNQRDRLSEVTFSVGYVGLCFLVDMIFDYRTMNPLISWGLILSSALAMIYVFLVLFVER